MRTFIGAIGLTLTIIGLPSNYDDLVKWRGWARFVLGDNYAPIFVLCGMVFLLAWIFWPKRFPKRPKSAIPALPQISIESRQQSGGQTGFINIAITGKPQMTAEEKAYRERLAQELDGHSHTLYKRVNEWYTAAVEQRYNDMATPRSTAETEMTTISRILSDKVGPTAASSFLKSRANEPLATSWIPHIKDGLAINSMWHRYERLDEIVRRVRSGEESITWPPVS